MTPSVAGPELVTIGEAYAQIGTLFTEAADQHPHPPAADLTPAALPKIVGHLRDVHQLLRAFLDLSDDGPAWAEHLSHATQAHAWDALGDVGRLLKTAGDKCLAYDADGVHEPATLLAHQTADLLEQILAQLPKAAN